MLIAASRNNTVFTITNLLGGLSWTVNVIIGFICNFIKQSFFLINFEHLVVVFPSFVIKYFDLIVFESRIIIVILIIIQRLVIL